MANLSNINGKFVVEQTTGYVGVGTTDPNYPIEVLNASAEIALNASGGSIYRLRSDSTDSFRINKNGVGDRLVIAGNGNATFSGKVGINTAATNAILTVTGSVSDDWAGRFENTSTGGFGILAKINSTSSGDYIFQARTGTNNVMTITGSGNVGIGTTSPNVKTEIAASVNGNPATTGGTQTNGALRVRGSATNVLDIGQQSAAPYGMWMQVCEATSLGVSYPLILNPNGGNVGIGTASPGTFLQLGSYPVSGTYVNIATYPDIPSEHMMHLTAPSTTGYYGGGISFGENAFTAANITAIDAGGGGALHLAFGTGSASGMTERLRITNDGNVGIGTTAPDNKLTVKAANCIIDAQSTADSQTIGFRAGYLNHGTLAGFFRYTTGDAQLYIDNEFVGNNAVYSDINFRNKTTGGTLTTRMKIKGSTGNVGIGTPSPNKKLTVYGGNDNGIWIDSQGGQYTSLAFGHNGTEKANIAWDNTNGYTNISTYASGHLAMSTGGGIKAFLNSSGNFGIGTTSPAAKLHVVGTSTQLMLETPNSTNDIDFRFRENGTNKWNIRYQNATEDLQILNQIGPTIVQMHFESNPAKVGIGNVNPTGRLTVEDDNGNQLHLRHSNTASGRYWNFDVASDSKLYVINEQGTGVYIAHGATSWTGTSDESLKENIKPLENVLDKIKDYRCVEYNLKSVPDDKKIGFIAQDWKNDFAPIVDEDNDGLLGMKYTETIPVLLKAIQELKAEIELLKNK